MNKYKLLHFGHCYINQEGDFAIGLLGGNKKYGYTFIASSANPNVMLGKIHIQSRVVPNDGHWTEIGSQTFYVASSCHESGYAIGLLPHDNSAVFMKNRKLFLFPQNEQLDAQVIPPPF